jgi:copper homeostasis protein
MNKNKYILEICANSYASALAAKLGGAQRIELCCALSEGGLTPSYGELKRVCEKIDIQVNVLIRPRGGDFLYSIDEFETIKADVLMAKKLNANGVVVGFLNADGTIDLNRTREIVELAHPMRVTFHRAIDRCNDIFQALEVVISSGCERILTSGGKNKAIDAIDTLKNLVIQANDRIVIMPGAGVDVSNIAELAEITRAKEFHTSAKSTVKSGMNHKNKNTFMGTLNVDEYSIVQSDVELVKKIVDELSKVN